MDDAKKMDLFKKQRAAFKGQLTALKSQSSTATTVGGLESLLHRLQLIYNKYDSVQNKLEVLDDDTISDRVQFEDDYGKLDTLVRTTLHDLKRSEESANMSLNQNTSFFEANNSSSQSVGIRLPEITLPSFSGLEADWLAFRDVFVDLIHSKTLEPTIKFLYLISSIRSGVAYALIENLSVTASNYEMAWTALCTKYNNEFSLQQYHVRQLYDIKTPREGQAKDIQNFIDVASKHHNALKALKVEVESWDLSLTHHLLHRLDPASRIHIVKRAKINCKTSFSELIEILRDRIRILNICNDVGHRSSAPSFKDHRRAVLNVSHSSVKVSESEKCSYCFGHHSLVCCPTFSSSQVTPKMRFQFIKGQRLCGNCLMQRHFIRDCDQPPCSKCSLKHHLLLHFEPTVAFPCSETQISVDHPYDQNQNQTIVSDDGASYAACTSQNVPSGNINQSNQTMVLLGTAIVNATAGNANSMICRALLDSGSTMNFVTSNICRLLHARKFPTSKTITGIGASHTQITHKTFITISSRISSFSHQLKFYILPKITKNIPCVPFDLSMSPLPSHIQLADPHFNIPDRIDLLLGAEVYHMLFTGVPVRICAELPPFHNSELGYVISGKATVVLDQQKTKASHVVLCSVQSLETQVKRFWELENFPTKTFLSKEEEICEEHYCSNVSRLIDGRYGVALPTKPNIDQLGHSHFSAQRQFLNLEKRLNGKPEIYQQYRDFMNEYLSLGHMTAVDPLCREPSYYVPHHHVIKEQSTTTKLRVVFNASAKTSSQISLNDCLMVGPTIQRDIFSLLIRFRMYPVAFSGDIAKMYRQIRVRKDQQGLQRIFWRNHPSHQLESFNLCTVTYGTACAPFLATRTLKQLSLDEYDTCPAAAKVLADDFYVDDVLTGADTIESAIQLKTNLIDLLKRGGFELRKFASNVKILASDDQPESITLVLGLTWNTEHDHFETPLDILCSTSHATKRSMLSEICQLFDPLGICAPITLTAKLFMQAIWMHRDIGWDDSLPTDISQKWNDFKDGLKQLAHVKIPRLATVTNTTCLELHGFCDASEKAYGCVIYIRALDNASHYTMRLLCAKSRVAPLKRQTIPRLELCAAVLLAELVNKLKTTIDQTFEATYLWSDSMISLYRIKSEAYKFTTFVANRVARIQELTPFHQWRYVRSAQNPADIVSKGLLPMQFESVPLWWNGPEFLKLPKTLWPSDFNCILPEETKGLEIRKPTNPILLQQNTEIHSIFTRFNSATTLFRVMAYILRFVHNARDKITRNESLSKYLQPQELHNATSILIKLVQRDCFSVELTSLKTGQQLPNKSSLLALSAFLDADGILRVGGRLVHAAIQENQKHPILLPGCHILSTLIARQEHFRLLHAGPQALLYSLRRTYWIIGGRNLCRSIVHNCIRCFHTRPILRSQIMGDLPYDRVNSVERPFTIVGIDFCGPFLLKQSTKSKLKIKVYICLFVCFATKAVHLELVFNSTTESFLACLKRFVSRRGICSKIYTDNATNFIGARKELQDLRSLFLSQSFIDSTIRFCTANCITWNTIPTRTPHFGGLWEAAVKSAKFHLKRVIGTSILTTEEFLTLSNQIEACLNSRPLTAQSSDPNDLSVLSPGHFLIGAPLTAVPEPSLLDLNVSKLSRFQRVQQLMQQFWNRWQTEYLSELQRRSKWNRKSIEVHIGSLALIHDDDIPPTRWKLGRIIELHPDKTGITRVVTLKTATTILKRGVNRISVLPLDEPSPTIVEPAIVS